MQISAKRIQQVLILISIAALVWVVHRLWSFDNWSYFYAHIRDHRYEAMTVLAVQLLLLLLNLTLETQKWKILVSPVARISTKRSFSQVVKSIQMGLITPFRAGETVGRAAFFNRGGRTRVAILSLAGSTLQNGIIFLAAVIAFCSINDGNYPLSFQLKTFYSQVNTGWILGVVALILIALLIFHKFHSRSVRIFRNIQKQFLIFKSFQTIIIVKITVITALRYLVFSSQLYLFLQFFGLTNLQNGFLSVFIYFGALSFFPSAGAGDLGVRATLALLIFDQTELTAPAIILSSLCLWVFNLGIPALIPIFSDLISPIIPGVDKQTVST